MNYLSATEIRKLGILHELNRQFLHPLGIAAELDLATSTLRLQDHRDDPEGVVYANNAIERDKCERFHDFSVARHVSRLRGLGFIVQAVPSSPPGHPHS